MTNIAAPAGYRDTAELSEDLDEDLRDLAARLDPVVADALHDSGVASSPAQFEVLVARLAFELRRDLGVI